MNVGRSQQSVFVCACLQNCFLFVGIFLKRFIPFFSISFIFSFSFPFYKFLFRSNKTFPPIPRKLDVNFGKRSPSPSSLSVSLSVSFSAVTISKNLRASTISIPRSALVDHRQQGWGYQEKGIKNYKPTQNCLQGGSQKLGFYLPYFRSLTCPCRHMGLANGTNELRCNWIVWMDLPFKFSKRWWAYATKPKKNQHHRQ